MSGDNHQHLLRQYNNFEECVLLDYWSEDLCRTFTMLVSNIWEAPGKMVEDLNALSPVYLRFRQCQQIIINNAFSESVWLYPELVNWGMNEFSIIKEEKLDDAHYKFSVLWERERYIQVVCQSLQIQPGIETPEMKLKYSRLFAPND